MRNKNWDSPNSVSRIKKEYISLNTDFSLDVDRVASIVNSKSMKMWLKCKSLENMVCVISSCSKCGIKKTEMWFSPKVDIIYCSLLCLTKLCNQLVKTVYRIQVIA